MKILVAEDDAVLHKLLKRRLTAWGYQVVSAANGRQAWDALQDPDAPRLVVIDWMMPEMDGIDICRQLRQQKTDAVTYLILLTARDDKKDILKGLEAGADDYITKPFDTDELRARINVGRRILELQAARQERDKLQGKIETTATVCHEMNQPLQVVAGTAELLLMNMPPDSPYYEKIKKIKIHSDKMGAITKKLMGITLNES